ncbi:MAG: hypothetical protein ACFFBE_08885 [Promethearchaeota archaeon]
MKQVKGTSVLTVVKSIRANKSKKDVYDRMLSNKAKEFLKKRILVASWYPFEEYRECFDALCYVEASNNPKTIVGWGIRESKLWFTTVYQSTIVKNDFLQLILERYSRFHKRMFNFGEVAIKFISDTELEFTYIEMPRNWENYYHIASGYVIGFIELSIGKIPEYSFLNKSWIGAGWTKIKFSWSP